MSIELVSPPNHLCCPLLLPSSIFPSIRVFPISLHIRWPKYWSFGFSISPSYEYSGLISFRMDWLDFLAVQGTLKNLLQHHSSKASILWCSAFFIVPTLTSICDYQRKDSFDYTDICQQCNHKLLFNMLSRLIIAFLPKSKCLLISWVQSTYAEILEPKKIVTVSIFPLFATK